MSVEHMAIVLHHSKASGTRKLVLLGIANHQGDGGAWPSVSTLATYANVAERNVQRSLAWLVSKGELRVYAQEGGMPNAADHTRPNRYEVNVACPPWCDRTPQHRDTRRLAGRQLRLPGLSTGVTLASPPLSTGVTPASPGGVTLASPEPSIEPTSNHVVPQLQDTRACQDCGQPQRRCVLQQRAWPATDRHSYRPVEHASG